MENKKKKQLRIPLNFQRRDEVEMLIRSEAFLESISRRRTVRHYSEEKVDRRIIENAIRAAGSAPSGANLQPWYFAAVSDQKVKHRIRIAAEKEEREFYAGKAGDQWLGDLKHLGTNADKPYLEKAPWLIAVFAEKYRMDSNGKKVSNYYVPESVGIACGMLITALHLSGLATLTHTPAPMNFLNGIFKRPKSEKPFLILVAGYPAEGATVPAIGKKNISELAAFYE